MARFLPSDLSLSLFRVAQILNFLREINVDAELCFYARHTDYLKDSLSQKKSDLLIAMDYIDGNSEPLLHASLEGELNELANHCLADGAFLATARSAYSLALEAYVPVITIEKK